MTDRAYWRQRELENIAADYTSDRQMLAKIKNLYTQQLLEIQKEIDSFYQRYATTSGMTIAAAKRAVSGFDVAGYEATAKRLVEARDLSPEANQQLKIYNATMRINRLELLKSKIGLHLIELGADYDSALKDYTRNMSVKTYTRQSGILGDSVNIDTWTKADQLITASYHNATFSERIWGAVDVIHVEIDKRLTQYLINGRSSIELARALRKVFDSAQYEAETLVRTEVRRIQTAVQEDFMRERGIGEYVFIAEPTACADCKKAENGGENNDGVYALRDLEVGVNASPIHPNCRCSIAPRVDRAEFEGDLERRGL